MQFFALIIAFLGSNFGYRISQWYRITLASRPTVLQCSMSKGTFTLYDKSFQKVLYVPADLSA